VFWSLLAPPEKRQAIKILSLSTFGVILELVSVGALVPLIQVLTQTDLKSKYPLVEEVFPNTTDQFVLVAVLVVVVGVFFLKEIFLGYSLWVQRGFIAHLEARFQTDLFDRYVKQAYEFHLINNSSILSRNILNSTNFINNVLDPILILLTDGTVMIALCVFLVVIEPFAMFSTIFAIGVFAVVFHFFSKRRIQQWGFDRQYQDGLKLQLMSETFSGMKEIRVSGNENFFRTRFYLNVQQLAHLNRKFTTLLGIPRLYLELLAVAGLAALVLSMLALGRTSESLLPVLALFAGGAFRLMPAVNRVTFALQSLRMGQAIINTVVEPNLMAERTTQQRIELRPLRFDREISFVNISYTYPNAGHHAIDCLSFNIKKGQKVGVVGSTGAGKSTFVDIFLGLLRPSVGIVSVDGIEIDTAVQSWQDLIGYVPQTIFLTDSSIEENIAFGINKSEIDAERIKRVVEIAQLEDYISSLSEGLKTFVGERGIRLSGGQRQRIGIARALYKDPPILVFDEATSALDVETERDVLNSLERLRSSKTMIIVTHRISALHGCDQILELENGRLVVKDNQ
jgi:ABC-type multidrug transport system fused ATPase/permease subunit